MSILSNEPDGLGFFYGFLPGDCRQVNVREESPGRWCGYVAGVQVAVSKSKEGAEQSTVAWMLANVERDDTLQ